MNKKELKIKLQQSGIDENLYNLDGKGRKDERFCIENTDGKWYVYFCERGVKTTNKIFDTENDACQFIFKQLL